MCVYNNKSKTRNYYQYYNTILSFLFFPGLRIQSLFNRILDTDSVLF